jgi:hypothetical protein
MPDTTRTRRSLSEWATIIATTTAALGFGLGLWQFWRTEVMTRKTLELQEANLAADREIKAYDFLDRFLKMKQEMSSASLTSEGEWRKDALLDLTEAVFRLTERSREWNETVSWMLSVQKPFLEQGGFDCQTFDGQFVRLMIAAAGKPICKAQ